MGSLGFSRYRPLGGMNWAPVLGMRQGPGQAVLLGMLISILLILLLGLGGWACVPTF